MLTKRIEILILAAGLVAVGAALISGCAAANRSRAEQLLGEGTRLLEEHDLEAALRELEAATQLSPQLAVAHSKMGIIYRRMGDYDRAIDCFAEAVRWAPRSFDDTFNLAQLYHFTKRLHDAVEAYLYACDLRPDNFDANLNLGVCYQQLGDYNQSAERFQQTIAIDGDRPHAYVNLGVAYDRQGKYYESIKAYKAALERDNHQPLVLVNLAYTYLNQGRHKLASKSLEQAVKMDPSLPAVHEAMGYCLFRMQNYERAGASYQEALALDPRLHSAYAGLGSIEMLKCLNQNKDAERERALEYWHRSLELNPDQPRIRRLIDKYRLPAAGPATVLLGVHQPE